MKSNTKAGPVCIRFVGNITDPSTLNKGDLLVDTVTCGLTIEGIGKDATFNGFGLVLKNSSNVEVRNIGFMNCNSSEGDNCGLQQGNDHVWVHHCDMFYGDAGSDADQVKGDGALDTKTSSYITHSYNHFWDNGKCDLQGMKSESTENYITYLVRDTSAGLRVDIPGVPAGTYSVSLTTAKGTIVQSGLEVNAQDRSGYAHFDYTAGVGAYQDNGTLKPNTNAGIIKKLAEDGTPLVVRIVGSVKAPAGLTAYDSTDFGGSVGDNGYMARMKSGKDVTIEGIGTDAVVDGWGFHFIAETAAPDFGKSFEIRNIVFRNVPEDCVGMEGVQESSKLTAPVEHCWVHNCEFYKPTISNPAESDKAGGDGACDFKRGLYFTNSYCYYEGYHKTDLVGASDSNLQFHLTYHHNYWNKCGSRGPLARQANIHMYNDLFIGQTSYCMDSRANAYIFSEYNYFENCKDPMQVKLGAVKSYHDVLTGCKGDQQGTVVTDKSAKVDTDCQYANFDTNASICYIPSGDYFLQTDTSALASYFEVYGGTMDATTVALGTTSVDGSTTPTTPTDPQPAAVRGDVDADGKVSVSDVVMLQKYLLGAASLLPICKRCELSVSFLDSAF